MTVIDVHRKVNLKIIVNIHIDQLVAIIQQGVSVNGIDIK